MIRRICVITGTRAEYGILRPLLFALNKQKNFKLSIIITGMHLIKTYGYSYKEVIKDGFDVIGRINCIDKNDLLYPSGKSIAKCILGVSKVLLTNKQDYIIVIGDRFEMLAGSIAGAFMNIPIVHIQGGDSSGNIDNSIRDMISKIAHIHFSATNKSALKLIKIGEQKWRIHVVGALAIDSLKLIKRIPRLKIMKKYNLNVEKPIILLIQHSVTTQLDQTSFQINETIKAITKLKYNTIIIYPNTDVGGRIIIKKISKLSRYPFVRIHKNINHNDYLNLLQNTDVIVGNSSSALIEAPYFKIPAVNIGIRQKGREHSNNVINVDHNAVNIENSIQRALKIQKESIENIFGNGDSSKRIINILRKSKSDLNLIQK